MKNKDGSIHVQNAVMGMFGQHHVHDKKGFEEWKKGVNEEDIIYIDGECDCGLQIGDCIDGFPKPKMEG